MLEVIIWAVASLWGEEGAARPRCHHFGVTPCNDVKPFCGE